MAVSGHATREDYMLGDDEFTPIEGNRE